MKILTISADCPPHHSGGYGIRIKNIMDGLAERRHEIFIITNKPSGSKHKDQKAAQYPVYRILHNNYGVRSFFKEICRDVIDVNRIDGVVRRFQPDLIYLGHIYPLTKQLMPYLSSLNLPIVCDEGGNSLKGAWTDHGRWYRFTGDYQPRFRCMNHLKPLIVSIVGFLSGGRIGKDWAWPSNLSAIFNSRKNQSSVFSLGVPLRRSQVFYSGIGIEKFTFQQREAFLPPPLKIICPGRIEPSKGQLDAVRLITALREQGVFAELILVGKVVSEEYGKQILAETRQYSLDEQVQILPMISQEDLVKFYRKSEICFFPSYQELGLSRIPLEAMACGCIVISYGNEGSDEIITDSENGFLVAPGDIDQVAQLLGSLLFSPPVVQDICSKARKDVTEKYSLPGYIDKIESLIQQAFEERY